MINTLMPFLASALIISSGNPFLPQPQASNASTLKFNQVLPEDNIVVLKIEKNENLKTVAASFYGNKEFWINLWNDNPAISNPQVLTEGQYIQINISKPEKIEALTENLKKKYLQLYPKPVYKPVTPIITNTVSYTLLTFEEVYKSAGTKYGIPWEILYGIHMTETGCRDGAITSGYGTGAQGPMQFMPGTWKAYGVDGDGDGYADINNAKDAINGAANYLVKHGSLENGLRSYGGNTPGILSYARSKGYNE